MFEYSMRNSSS